ncbi:hypothetical protein LUI11_30070 [Bradyrhizobium diazoefficiens]|uniref:Uncharacterized protein n=2 Tax=Bradyrhizobium diazoefficiens TaxID=1355477 RepID=A0A810CUM4_9BRAD|nr:MULTISPECIES: hypothetical protein [Bradyrhizobium]APO52844.1 hypothetical protein BD122_21235 [Bradyrhizobium diazoefficiens]KGJ70618.1 hypothetical protein BJA5080_06742 [Bradyrhizobium diazoefficiens SEMIA 5080]KOY08754.1 hypothetical protein AF336_19805 [Bradyrhizobium diazoefficiens]MCD9297078.1 hypothetical protein [Bradyrhizobium diazoefficiens]MCD9814685.1 hypothetical protein [Bradyrhizobium diazoefficiens]
MAVYFWVFGVAVFAGLEIYLGMHALRNLAPGVERKDITFFRKFSGQVDKNFFNDEGQKYRAWMMRNEVAHGLWIFAIGPFAISVR